MMIFMYLLEAVLAVGIIYLGIRVYRHFSESGKHWVKATIITVIYFYLVLLILGVLYFYL